MIVYIWIEIRIKKTEIRFLMNFGEEIHETFYR
jgi:hypothetical protein